MAATPGIAGEGSEIFGPRVLGLLGLSLGSGWAQTPTSLLPALMFFF
jgi:hypothetical protein